MITEKLETVTGKTVVLGTDNLDESKTHVWTYANDGEVRAVRFSAYLATLRSDLETYGVGINRYWNNNRWHERTDGPDEPVSLIIDDLVRVPSGVTAYNLPVVAAEGSDLHIIPVLFGAEVTDDAGEMLQTSERGVHFGRLVTDISTVQTAELVDMISKRAHPDEVAAFRAAI
jgi:hypothetical protein